MKTYLLWVFAIVLLSCNKSQEPNIPYPELYGKWEIVRIEDSNGPDSIYPKMHGNYCEFGETDYKHALNWEVYSKGPYKVVDDISPIDGRKLKRIIYGNNNSIFTEVKLKEDTMSMITYQNNIYTVIHERMP